MVHLHSVQLTLVNTPLVEKMHQSLQGAHEINAQNAFNAAVESLHKKRHQVNETPETYETKHTEDEGGSGKNEFHEQEHGGQRKEDEEKAREASFAEHDQGKTINIEV